MNPIYWLQITELGKPQLEMIDDPVLVRFFLVKLSSLRTVPISNAGTEHSAMLLVKSYGHSSSPAHGSAG